MAKKIYGIIVIIIFAAILVVPTLVWGGMIIAGGEEFIQSEIIVPIESENRRAKSFDDVLKGKTNENGEEEPFSLNDLTANLESLYNDYAPFRGDLVYIQGKMIAAIERPYKNTIGPALVELFYGNKNEGEQVKEDTTGINMDDIFGPEPDPKPEDTTEDDYIPLPVPDTEIIGTDAADCQHEFGEAVVETPASCEEHGSTIAECSKCGAKQRVYIEATGHNYEVLSETEATCLINGISHQQCSNCKKEKDVVLPKEEHKFEQIKTVATSYEDCGYDLYKCAKCELLRRENIVPKLIDTSVLPVTYRGNGRAIVGRSGWLFYTGNKMEQYYTGTNIHTTEAMDLMVSALDNLNIECQKRGIKLVVAFWPNKCDVYSEYMPTYEIVNSVGKTETMSNYVNANTQTGVVSIYPKAELLAAKSYFQTYYNKDTHWNNAGGFMGAQALLKAIGMEMTDIRKVKYTTEVRNPRRGDIYNMLLDAEKEDLDVSTPDYDYTFDYRPEIEVLEEYANDRFGSYDIEACLTTNENGKSIFLIGDSFRRALYPYIKKEFTRTTFTHADMILNNRTGDVLNDILVSDVLVLARGSRVDDTVYSIALKLTEAMRNADY